LFDIWQLSGNGLKNDALVSDKGWRPAILMKVVVSIPQEKDNMRK
jgi:hypothetical protein